MSFLAAFGHVVVDRIMRVERFPAPNSSIAIRSQRTAFGGTAGNLARMASRLGVGTALASFVGDDFPKKYYAALKEDGVDLEDLRVVKGRITPVCYVFTDGKNQLNFIDQGAMKDAEMFDVLEHAVRSSKVVHIGTGSPGYYGKVVALCRKLGRDVAFDPGQEIHYMYDPESLRVMLEASKYMFCNEGELQRALAFLDLEGPKDLLDFVDVLVVTRGEKGSEIYASRSTINVPAVKPGKFVDATGAGDAYRAGFYAGLSRCLGLEECGMAGAAASSIVVESLGAQTDLPSWKDVGDRLKAHSQQRREKHIFP